MRREVDGWPSSHDHSRLRETTFAATAIGPTHHASNVTASIAGDSPAPAIAAVKPAPAVVSSPLNTRTLKTLAGLTSTSADSATSGSANAATSPSASRPWTSTNYTHTSSASPSAWVFSRATVESNTAAGYHINLVTHENHGHLRDICTTNSPSGSAPGSTSNTSTSAGAADTRRASTSVRGSKKDPSERLLEGGTFGTVGATFYSPASAGRRMNESIGRALAVLGAVVAVLIAVAGLLQLPGSVSGSDGFATGATFVVTAAVAALVVAIGLRWAGRHETPYW